jgi:hypothetical protein
LRAKNASGCTWLQEYCIFLAGVYRHYSHLSSQLKVDWN